MVVLLALLHGELGAADELALMGLSAIIGLALAYFLKQSKKQP